MTESGFASEHFARQDETPDANFYAEPRLLVHIDDGAIAAARALYGKLLPVRGAILDLMSSYRSHLPEDGGYERVAGLGMNAVEMARNDQLTEFLVHDLNADPRLPYGDAEFDGCVVTVSVQYLVQPVDVFREVGRVLRDGAPLVLTYSNRMFPTKAVRVWMALGDRDRALLVGTYFDDAGCFGNVSAAECTAGREGYNDPLFGVWAHRVARGERGM
jgi:SAM-dependent methyltransferase